MTELREAGSALAQRLCDANLQQLAADANRRTTFITSLLPLVNKMPNEVQTPVLSFDNDTPIVNTNPCKAFPAVHTREDRLLRKIVHHVLFRSCFNIIRMFGCYYTQTEAELRSEVQFELEHAIMMSDAGPHLAIRHMDLRYFWYISFRDADEVGTTRISVSMCMLAVF